MNFLADYLCLEELLDADISSYEYFCSLPESVKQKIEMNDARSFEEIQIIAKQEQQNQFFDW